MINKKIQVFTMLAAGLLFLAMIYGGCTKRGPLANPDEPPRPNWAYAVLTSIEPDSGKPGEMVTIKGAGFYSETSVGNPDMYNGEFKQMRDKLPFVWFGVDTAYVDVMNPNDMTVVVPYKLDKKGAIDSTFTGVVDVKVALYGSLNWSNVLQFKILPLKEE